MHHVCTISLEFSACVIRHTSRVDPGSAHGGSAPPTIHSTILNHTPVQIMIGLMILMFS